MLDSWLASDWTAITGNPGKLWVAAGISDAATPTAYRLAFSQRAVASIDLVRHPLHRTALRTLRRCDPELDRGHHWVRRRRCGAPPPPLRVAGHSFACMHSTFVPTSSCPFQFIPVSSSCYAHILRQSCHLGSGGGAMEGRVARRSRIGQPTEEGSTPPLRPQQCLLIERPCVEDQGKGVSRQSDAAVFPRLARRLVDSLDQAGASNM